MQVLEGDHGLIFSHEHLEQIIWQHCTAITQCNSITPQHVYNLEGSLNSTPGLYSGVNTEIHVTPYILLIMASDKSGENDLTLPFELLEYTFHQETHTQLNTGRERKYTHVVIKRVAQNSGKGSHQIELLSKTIGKMDEVRTLNIQ